MDFDLTNEQSMLAEATHRYVRERCTLEQKRTLTREQQGFSSARWNEFAEMGWLALPVPETQGGLGGGPVELALLMEALGRGLVNEPVAESAVLCGSLLAHAQAQGQSVVLLEGLVSGAAVPVLAHLEAGDRSDYEAAVATRATQHADGWRLSGHKLLVRHGASATHWLVTARTTAGVALFVVDSASAGARMEPYLLIDGSWSVDLHFDDLTLPGDALLLAAGPTASALVDSLDLTVLALCATALGSMEAVMAMTAEYLKTRVQYGQPLARFQALQHRMAEMFVETDQARALLFRAIAAVETGEPLARARAVSAAKWLISKAGLFVTAQGIQLHGGIGTTEEYAVGHHYKAMVSFDKRLGNADFHLLRSSDLFQSAS